MLPWPQMFAQEGPRLFNLTLTFLDSTCPAQGEIFYCHHHHLVPLSFPQGDFFHARVNQILIILMAPASETSVFPCDYWEVGGITSKANAAKRPTLDKVIHMMHLTLNRFPGVQ